MSSRFLLLFFSISTLFAQTHTLSGIIRDASSGEGLPYANISTQDNTLGTSSDSEGKFDLTLKNGIYSFIVSYIGYKTETLSVEINNSDKFLLIPLQSTDVLLQEISVYSSAYNNNKAASNVSLQSKEVEKISSIFPDVFRSIQALPGLSVNNEFSAKFNVRGGNYDENLVLVNNTQVYEPFHLKEAENASVGIFNLDLMKKVNIITGGFSAEYGDRLSSVLNIEYREGNKEKVKGSSSFSLLNIDGYIEGPIYNNFNFILGVRKSYLKYVMKMMDYADYVKPDFYDIQGVLTYDITDVDKLQFKFIHSGDDFKYEPGWEYNGPFNYTRNWWNQQVNVTESNNNFDENKSKYYSNLFDLKSSLFLSPNAFLTTNFSYYEQTDNEYDIYTETYDLLGIGGNNQYIYNSDYKSLYDKDLTIKTAEVKSVLDTKISPYYDIKAGGSFIHIDYLQSLKEERLHIIYDGVNYFPQVRPDTLLNYKNPDQHINTGSYKLAGFTENIIQLNDDLLLNAGIRGDYFELNRDLNISPRLSASYNAGNSTTIRAAWGHYYQSPIYSQLAYSTASDTNTQSQKAVHYNLGVEHIISFDNNLARNLTLKADFYYKDYSDIISSKRDAFGRLTYSRKNDSKAYAAGFDLYASLKYDWYYGWISYGYLTAEEDYLQDSDGYFPRYSDQTHTISFINDIDLGKQWSMNLRFNYGSGFPFTPQILVRNAEERLEWEESKTNSARLPDYKRVDMRITRNFSLFGFQASAFLDVSNMLNFKNILGYRYNFDQNGQPEIEEVELWPIVPSLGLRIDFE